MDKAGIECDLCSPKGGYIPIDPVSLQFGNVPADWKYYADEKFRHKLGHSLKPEEVKIIEINFLAKDVLRMFVSG